MFRNKKKMISEFRRMKILYIFQFFFDQDSSETIDETDFTLAIENIANFRKWSKSDEKYKKVEAAMMKIWECLKEAADKDNDGKVTVEEWLSMWEDYSKDQKALLWQDLFCKFIFDLEDESGDGSIDKDEFRSVLESFGLLKEDAENAFEKISKGSSNVTWSEFQVLWNEYISSENASDPGNFIFGTPPEWLIQMAAS